MHAEKSRQLVLGTLQEFYFYVTNNKYYPYY